jgi:hypothetical protein
MFHRLLDRAPRVAQKLILVWRTRHDQRPLVVARQQTTGIRQLSVDPVAV